MHNILDSIKFMFPTSYKDKIPKTLSYPIKAKLISETFADVPQAEDFEIYFSANWALGFRKQGSPCEVVSVSYRYHKVTQYTSHLMEEMDGNRPNWQITIAAIPIENSHYVAELLQNEAFPKLHKWLFSKNNLSCKPATAWFGVIYNEELDRLEYDQDFKQL